MNRELLYRFFEGRAHRQKFTTFKNGLLKCRNYIFNFLKNPQVHLTTTLRNEAYGNSPYNAILALL